MKTFMLKDAPGPKEFEESFRLHSTNAKAHLEGTFTTQVADYDGERTLAPVVIYQLPRVQAAYEGWQLARAVYDLTDDKQAVFGASSALESGVASALKAMEERLASKISAVIAGYQTKVTISPSVEINERVSDYYATCDQLSGKERVTKMSIKRRDPLTIHQIVEAAYHCAWTNSMIENEIEYSGFDPVSLHAGDIIRLKTLFANSIGCAGVHKKFYDEALEQVSKRAKKVGA